MFCQSQRVPKSDQDWLQLDLDVIKSLQLPWGPVVAAPGAHYDRVWIRDNCQVAWCLWLAGEKEMAKSILKGLFRIYHNHAYKLDWIQREGKPLPAENWKLLHPVYNRKGEELGGGWGWNQNDAIGFFLLCAAKFGSEAGILADNDRELLQRIVEYLHSIRYWEEDNSIWEETPDVNVPSIQSCIVGLKAIASFVEVPPALITAGEAVLELLGEKHSFSHPIDLCHLQVAFPLGVELPTTIIENIEQHLLRDHGVIRYLGDRYEAIEGEEPEWPLGILWLGLSWLNLGQRDKAADYLKLADHLRLPGGYFPESYIPIFAPEGQMTYVPCNHVPLSWTHAFALALRYLLMN